MNDVIQELSLIGIVPVIKIDDAADALPLAEALMKGGLPCAEVTFRTAAGKDAIAAIAKAYPDMLVGAGTVLTPAQVDDAAGAGAKFIVSPGFNPDVVKYCQKIGMPIVPGINNPTGIEQALALGLDVVKFFPAEQSGGIAMIKAMSAPYTGVKFMPTGGLSPANVNDYLSFNKIVACGGSWMVKGDMIAAKDFAGIEKLVREAVDTILGFEFRHMAINEKDEASAAATANALGSLFAFPVKDGTKSLFAGSAFEIMKNKAPGTHGHIAIATNNVDRAVYHLGRRGVAFDEESATFNKDGSRKFIYLKGEVGGFAIHLIQK